MNTYKLRDYQAECSDSIMTHIKDGKKKIGAILPVGTGKTEIFIDVANRYVQDNPDKLVLVLSHLGILTGQSTRRFKKRYPQLEIGNLQASQRPTMFDQVVIGTMQSASDYDKLTQWMQQSPKSVGMLIIDECHYITTVSYKKIIDYFSEAVIVGVSATPFKSAQLMTQFFDTIAYHKPLHEMINQGYLVKPNLHEILLLDDTLIGRVSQVVDLYVKKEMGKKAIVFMKTIEDCTLCRNSFVTAGVNAKVVTSEITGDERDQILEHYEDYDTDVLVTVNVLTAGFDSPKTEAIFMPYATHSPTQYMQRIGRGLRLCPEINKTECRIYAYGDAPTIKSGYYNFLDDLVKGKVKTKEEINDIHEELAYMECVEYDTVSEKYIWTQQVCLVADKMADIKMFELNKLIREKKFPLRFMNDLNGVISNLPDRAKALPHGDKLASDMQVKCLMHSGFSKEQLASISKNEAAAMIECIKKMEGTFNANDPHIIRAGKHAGKHVSELPFFYRNFVVKNLPDSSVAKQIRSYWSRPEVTKPKKKRGIR